MDCVEAHGKFTVINVIIESPAHASVGGVEVTSTLGSFI